jgi:hypothetical protein
MDKHRRKIRENPPHLFAQIRWFCELAIPWQYFMPEGGLGLNWYK